MFIMMHTGLLGWLIHGNLLGFRDGELMFSLIVDALIIWWSMVIKNGELLVNWWLSDGDLMVGNYCRW